MVEDKAPGDSGRARIYAGLALAVCCCVVGLGVLSRFAAGFVWDDAYMFVRYADNLLSNGRLSWNPGGEATYGITSCLYLAVVLAVRLLVSENPALAAGLSSLVSGIVFVVLLAILLRRYTDEGVVGRRLLVVMGLFSLAASTFYLSSHFVSGMDTAFALGFLTGYIVLCRRQERCSSPGRVLGVGIWGGMAFFARPDLMVYTFLVPVSMVVFGSGSEARRTGLLILGLTAVGTGIQVGFAAWFFNSALPLPFYAKGMRLYSDYLIEQYRLVPGVEFLNYLRSYWYLFLLVLSDLTLNFGRWRSGVSAVEKGLLIGTCFFIFCYLFFVLQIMPSHQRFYYPTLPALIFLAAQSAIRLIERIPESIRQEFRGMPGSVCFFAMLLLVGFLFSPTLSVAKITKQQILRGKFLKLDVVDNYRDRMSGKWFKLDVFSGLPNDLVMATTEVGHPAAMNPEKLIVDLTGLNETAFAHGGFSADRLLETYRPDLIYMPHSDYKRMIEQISGHALFAEHYIFFSGPALGVTLGVALRRDSKYYAAMYDIVEGGVVDRAR